MQKAIVVAYHESQNKALITLNQYLDDGWRVVATCPMPSSVSDSGKYNGSVPCCLVIIQDKFYKKNYQNNNDYRKPYYKNNRYRRDDHINYNDDIGNTDTRPSDILYNNIEDRDVPDTEPEKDTSQIYEPSRNKK